MTKSKESGLFEKGNPAADYLLEWWDKLKQNKGDRAELRRCRSLDEIQRTSAYQRCYWPGIKHFTQGEWKPNKEQMAIVVGVSAYVEDNDIEKKDDQQEHQEVDLFGYQISRGDKPKLSELKFRRLLKINDREKLFHFLIQIIRLLDKKLNLLDLLSVAYYWGEKTKTNLAYQYYEKAQLDN